jgi:uncharacterized protein YjdB
MKHFAMGMFLGAVLSVCACGTSETSTPVVQNTGGATLTVTPAPMALRVGETKQLKAEVTRADGTKVDVTSDPNIVWMSDDPKTAVVDNKGNVLGVSGGQTHIHASFGGGDLSALVTVVP